MPPDGVDHYAWHERLKAWAAFSASYRGPQGYEAPGAPEERVPYTDDDAMVVDGLLCELRRTWPLGHYAVRTYYLRQWWKDSVPGTLLLSKRLNQTHGAGWVSLVKALHLQEARREQVAEELLRQAVERLDGLRPTPRRGTLRTVESGDVRPQSA